MRNIITELLAIEKKANTASQVEEPMQYIQTEIQKKLALREKEIAAQLALLEENSHNETLIRLEQIKKDYQRKTNELEAAFVINRKKWLAQIKRDLLQTYQPPPRTRQRSQPQPTQPQLTQPSTS